MYVMFNSIAAHLHFYYILTEYLEQTLALVIKFEVNDQLKQTHSYDDLHVHCLRNFLFTLAHEVNAHNRCC